MVTTDDRGTSCPSNGQGRQWQRGQEGGTGAVVGTRRGPLSCCGQPTDPPAFRGTEGRGVPERRQPRRDTAQPARPPALTSGARRSVPAAARCALHTRARPSRRCPGGAGPAGAGVPRPGRRDPGSSPPLEPEAGLRAAGAPEGGEEGRGGARRGREAPGAGSPASAARGRGQRRAWRWAAAEAGLGMAGCVPRPAQSRPGVSRFLSSWDCPGAGRLRPRARPRALPSAVGLSAPPGPANNGGAWTGPVASGSHWSRPRPL